MRTRRVIQGTLRCRGESVPGGIRVRLSRPSGPFVGRGGQDRWIAEIVTSEGWPAVGTTLIVGGTPAAPVMNPDGLASPIRP